MRCDELMKQKVCYVTKDSTAQEAAQLMREENIGFLPVCDDQLKVLGTLTDRDLAIRLVADNRPANENVGKLMTNEVVSCLSSDDIRVVEQRMMSEQKSRIVCVDEDGRLEGVISLSDIVHATSSERAADTMRGVTKREAA